MVTIERRFKEIAYKPLKDTYPYDKSLKPKSDNIIFFICEELKEEDFKEPFFNSSQVIFLSDGFKFLYCYVLQNGYILRLHSPIHHYLQHLRLLHQNL